MSYELEITDKDRFVHIKFHGELTAENQPTVIAEIFSAIAGSGHRNALVDRQQGPLDPSALANYEEGKLISELPEIHRYRVAVVLRAEDFDQSPFLESVAIIRGVNWKFFRSEKTAIAWLNG